MRARADGRRGSRGIEAVVVLRNVDDDGNAAGLRDRLERRDECRRGNDDLGAGLDPGREEPQSQRVEPTADADAMADAAIGGKGLLELGDGRPVRERSAPEELRDVVEQRRLERPVHRREVEERNRWSSLGRRAGRHLSNLAPAVRRRHVRRFSFQAPAPAAAARTPRQDWPFGRSTRFRRPGNAESGVGSSAAAPGNSARTMRLAGALAVIAAVVLAVGHDRPTPSRGTSAVEVTYASAASLRAALVRHPAVLVQDIPALRVAEVRPTGDTTQYIRSLRRVNGIVAARPAVARAEADAPGLTLGVVSTPAGGAYEWQWYATGVDRVPATILAAAARTTIAIVDTGADLSTPALAGKVRAAYDVRSGSRSVADRSGHGTFVASIAGGSTVRGRGSRRLRRRRTPARRQGRGRNLRQRRRRGGGNRPLGAERRADRQRQPRRTRAFGRGGERGGLRRAARCARSSQQPAMTRWPAIPPNTPPHCSGPSTPKVTAGSGSPSRPPAWTGGGRNSRSTGRSSRSRRRAQRCSAHSLRQRSIALRPRRAPRRPAGALRVRKRHLVCGAPGVRGGRARLGRGSAAHGAAGCGGARADGERPRRLDSGARVRRDRRRGCRGSGSAPRPVAHGVWDPSKGGRPAHRL